MNAVNQVQEASAVYAVEQSALLRSFDLLATAPEGVARLRELILSLAVQGKLVPQDPNDEPASVLLERIRAEKQALIKAGKLKKDKPLAEIAEEEKPFKLPQGWEWARLGTVGTVGSSSRVHQKDWVTAGVPFYRAREIVKLSSDGSVDNELFITEDFYQQLSADGLVPEPGDLMITGVGTIGVPYVVKPSDRFYFKDASVLIFKNHFQLTPEFLFLFFKCPYWINQIHLQSMGTTVHTLTIGRANEVPLPLPPLPEQSRIVARVEELMQLCDALEQQGKLEAAQHARLVGTLFDALANSESAHALAENWQRVAASFDLLLDRPEAVDALEQTLLQLAVRGLLVPQDHKDEPASELLKKIRTEKDHLIATGKLKRDKPLPEISEEEKPFELPQGWEWARLSALSGFENGDRGSNYPSKSAFVNDGVRFINAGHLVSQQIDRAEMNFITEERFNSLRSGKVRRNDILYCLRGSLGKLALVADDDLGAIASSLVIVRAVTGFDVLYAMLYFSAPIAQLLIRRFDNGTAQPNLGANDLAKFVVPLPPLAEQSRIVARVAELRELCADLRARLTAARTTQTHLAEALVEQAA